MFCARRLSLLMLCLLAVATQGQPGSAADNDWTGWMGQSRDGWLPDYQPPEPWPEKLERRWQAEVGTGYGSPLLSGEQVFLHTRLGGSEVVWCFDLANGDIVWKTKYEVPFTMGGGGEWHGKGPKSSPAFADGRLFTMSITGVLSAWDAATGERLWRRDDGAAFGQGHPYWGAATSPIVVRDRVIVHFGGDDRGVLMALDTATGETLWRQGQDGASYSSPIVAELQGVRQVIEWNHRALVGVNIETGEKLWEYPFPHEGSNQNMPTPVIHNECIVLSGENRGMHSLCPKRNGDTWAVETRWHQYDLALDMSSAVINDGLLYGFSHYDRGRLFCLDPESGEILWLGPGRAGDNAMFLSVPGYVIALMDDGELKVIAATGERLETVASYQVSAKPTWAPPVLFDEGVLIKDRETLIRWQFPGVE